MVNVFETEQQRKVWRRSCDHIREVDRKAAEILEKVKTANDALENLRLKRGTVSVYSLYPTQELYSSLDAFGRTKDYIEGLFGETSVEKAGKSLKELVVALNEVGYKDTDRVGVIKIKDGKVTIPGLIEKDESNDVEEDTLKVYDFLNKYTEFVPAVGHIDKYGNHVASIEAMRNLYLGDDLEHGSTGAIKQMYKDIKEGKLAGYGYA